MMFSAEESLELLTKAGVFFDGENEDPRWNQTLNLNDVWGWGCADGEYVPDHCLPELAELFYHYGFCGIVYWVGRRREGARSEFKDINRFIDFVANEECIREEVPDSNERAYAKREYVIGK